MQEWFFYTIDSVYTCPRKFLSGRHNGMPETCVVITEWLYHVSIYLFRVFYLIGDQTNLDKPIINKIEYTSKVKLIEDIKKVINYY